MDLNLAQVRAFVTTARCLHFGRAAIELGLSQQSLSKRIVRLEAQLGVRLFDRTSPRVRLTAEGKRFCEPAARALAAGESAVAALHGTVRPLRIDVWGHLYRPSRTLSEVVDHVADLDIELGVSRDLPAAITALLRGEIDAGFGRVHRTGVSGEETLTHRLVRLEPVDVVLGAAHALACARQVRAGDLRGGRLWAPAAVDRLDFLRHFADHFGLDTESGVNLGSAHLLEHLKADPRRFSLFPADAPLPDDPGVRAIPLVEPTPLYAWSLLWRDDTRHPGLDALLRGLAEIGRRSRWLEYVPDRDWLPDTDAAP